MIQERSLRSEVQQAVISEGLRRRLEEIIGEEIPHSQSSNGQFADLNKTEAEIER